MQALLFLLRSVKLNLFAAAEKLHKCICFPSLLEKTEPFIFCCMKRHHIMIILMDHFPSTLGCPFFLSLYWSLDKIFLKCYICLCTASWQKEGKEPQLFILQKISQVCLGKEQEMDSRTIKVVCLCKLIQDISSGFDSFLFLTWYLNETTTNPRWWTFLDVCTP